MSCDGRKEQILLYLTDGLDRSERDALESHLQTGCPRCAAQHSAARELLGWLPLALPPEHPPQRVKDRLMSRVGNDLAAATAPEHRADGTVALGGSGDAHSRRADSTPTGSLRLRGGRQRAAWQRLLISHVLPPLAAAALAIVVTYGLMITSIHDSQDRLADLEDRIADLQDNLESSSKEMDKLKSYHAVTDELLTTLHSSALRDIPLQRINDQESYWARLLWDLENDRGFLFANDMDTLQADAMYSLWFTPEGSTDPIQAAEFTFDQFGRARFEMNVPDRPGRFTHARVQYAFGGERERSTERERDTAGEHEPDPNNVDEISFGAMGAR